MTLNFRVDSTVLCFLCVEGFRDEMNANFFVLQFRDPEGRIKFVLTKKLHEVAIVFRIFSLS